MSKQIHARTHALYPFDAQFFCNAPTSSYSDNIVNSDQQLVNYCELYRQRIPTNRLEALR